MAIAPIRLVDLAPGVGFAVNGLSDGSLLGATVTAAGDVNGDGYDDVIVAAPGTDGNTGAVYVVYGGRAQGPIELTAIAAGRGGFALYGRTAGGGAGVSVAAVGDVDGDGVADILVGAPGAGEAYLVSGATGAHTHTLGSGDIVIAEGAGMTGFGTTVAAIGDINGDGFTDFFVTSPDTTLGRAAYVVLGRAEGFRDGVDLGALRIGGGTVLGTGGAVDNGLYEPVDVALAIASGDLNGDGLSDFVIGRPGAAGSTEPGLVTIRFGAPIAWDSHMLPLELRLHGLAGQHVGASVAVAGDLNGDGRDDLLVGATDADGTALVYVAYGQAAWGHGVLDVDVNLPAVATGAGGFVIRGLGGVSASGLRIASAGDVNGDGFDDLVIGVPVSAGEPYRAYVVFGRAGGFAAGIDLANVRAGIGGFVIERDALGSADALTVSRAGDVNGDGYGDLLVGDAAANGGTGAAYVVYGRDFTGTVTRQGTIGNNVLTGTAGADDMVGGEGNDQLIGNGGADTLIGGAGNDRISVKDLNFLRVDGGTGIDTLALAGAGMRLDLAAMGERLRGIERIDLTGTGNNRLVLTAATVARMASADVPLVVEGNAGDQVILQGGHWTRAGTDGGYTTFRSGAAVVRVATAVRVTAPVALADIAAGTEEGFAIRGADGDQLGLQIAMAGDVNGDGYDDFLVSANARGVVDGKPAAPSRYYLVFGGPQRLSGTMDPDALAAAGRAVVLLAPSGQPLTNADGVGDVDGDGRADIALGAYGNMYLLRGAGGAWTPSMELSGPRVTAISNGGIGVAMSAAGDINGDGIGDFIIGSVSDGDSTEDYIVYGRADGFAGGIDLSQVAIGIGGFALHLPDGSGYLSKDMAAIGDINGDGYDDVAIGLGFAKGTDGGSMAGAVYVVYGGPQARGTGVSAADLAAGHGGFALLGARESDYFGWSVGTGGDLNGDGIADLVVSTPSAHNVGAEAVGAYGAVYVIYGKAGGVDPSLTVADLAAGNGGVLIHGVNDVDLTGYIVSAAGDVNGDGIDDLLIGAPFAGAGDDRFESYVVFGRAGGFGAGIDLALVRDGIGGFALLTEATARAGAAAVMAGDLDGDGFGDLVIGEYQTGTGAAYVVYGRDFTGTVTQAGTAGNDTLVGSAAADDMVGGQGDDVLVGNGGADVLLGGAGNDRLVVKDLGFRRVDGGGGTDTLVLGGSGLLLDLAAVGEMRLRGIERIDLPGTGPNGLLLTAASVARLSATTNTLVIDGTASDEVRFIDDGWVQGSTTTDGYVTYTQGVVTLLVGGQVKVQSFAPIPTQPALATVDDTGVSATDGLTDRSVLTFSGSANPNATVYVYDGGHLLGQTTASNSGAWSFQTPTLADGPHYIAALQRTVAGVYSGLSTPTAVVVDTHLSAGPLRLTADTDTGYSDTDGITNAQAVTLTGSTEAGTQVVIYEGATKLGTATAGATGDWSFTTGLLAEGVHTLTAMMTDPAGNTANRTLAVTVDRTGFAAPTQAVTLDSPGNDPRPVLTGTTDPYASVDIYIDGVHMGHTMANASGVWHFQPLPDDALSVGPHVIVAQVADIAGNPGGTTPPLTITIGSRLPAPYGMSLTPATDTGRSDHDGITNAHTVTLMGHATPGAKVNLYLSAGYILKASTTALADGTFSFELHPLEAPVWLGAFSYILRAVDDQGVESDNSAIVRLDYDFTPPAAPHALALDPALVTVVAESGSVILDHSPTLTGKTEAFGLVTVYDNGTRLGQAQADATGTWSFQTDTPLASGAHKVVVTATDLAGNESGTSSTLDFAVADVPTAPAAPTLDAGSDSGRFTNDDVTNIRAVWLSGDAASGTVVELSENGGVLGTTTAGTDGHWHFKTASLTPGAHSIVARVVGAYGIQSDPSAALELTIDTTAPARPDAPVLDTNSDTGASSTDRITNVTRPVLTGTGVSGTQMRILIDGAVVATVDVVDGAWSYQPDASLAVGSHLVRVQAIDLAGNESAASAALSFRIVATPATPTKPDLAASSDSGVSDSDNITRYQSLTLTGEAGANARVAIFDGTTQVGVGTADSKGGWTIRTTALTDGSHSLTAKVLGTGGFDSAASAALTVTIDTTVSASLPVLDPASGVGGITNDNTPVITGKSEAGATVTLLDGGTTLGTATADSKGDWSIETKTLADGKHVLRTQVTDVAGNLSRLSDPLTVTIDTHVPTVPTLTGVTTTVMTGTADAGSVVTISHNGFPLGMAAAGADGRWSFAGIFANSSMSLSITAKDAAGNTATNVVGPLRIGTDGADTFGPGSTAVTYAGGAGDDVYYVTDQNNVVIELPGNGSDTIYASSSYTLATGSSIEFLRAAAGGNTGLYLTGNELANEIHGGAGNDVITGGGGLDKLYGGAGADKFVYTSVADSRAAAAMRDVIADFSKAQGDKIDLSAVDANSVQVGRQSFAFIGGAAFSGAAGELRAYYAGSETWLMGDVNGDKKADFGITLTGRIALTAGDLIL